MRKDLARGCRGRWDELDEFHVGDRRPRAVCQRDPVPRGDVGVARVQVHLSEPPVARTVASATKVRIAPVFLSST